MIESTHIRAFKPGSIARSGRAPWVHYGSGLRAYLSRLVYLGAIRKWEMAKDALNLALAKRFPEGTEAEVTANFMAGQDDAFVGIRGTVAGYCCGEVVINTREGPLCFRVGELTRVT